jgi:hypothetical protein
VISVTNNFIFSRNFILEKKLCREKLNILQEDAINNFIIVKSFNTSRDCADREYFQGFFFLQFVGL